MLSACGKSNQSEVYTYHPDGAVFVQSSGAMSDFSTLNSIAFFTRDVQPIFQKNCANCHGKGKVCPIDYTDYATALANKDLLQDRLLVKKDMPMGSSLDQVSLGLISSWLAGGALKDEVYFASDIKAVFANQCANCHGKGKANPLDFTDYATAYANKLLLSDRLLVKKDMPMGATLDQQTLDMISAWLSEGALQDVVYFDRDVQPILQTSCTACHGKGKANPNDYTDYQTVLKNKDLFSDRLLVKKDMPMGGTLQQHSLDLITSWLVNGMPKAPPVSFSKDIAPIFKSKCAVCHGSGKSEPHDFTDYATAFANKDLINNRVVVKKDMPMGSTLPQATIDLVASWVNGGAKP